MGVTDNDSKPFLTTQDVVRLTGISKRMLSEYVKKGIVKPQRAGSSSTSDLLWTYEMVSHVKKIPTLLRGTRKLDDIAKATEQGSKAANDLFYEQLVKEDRDARRALKEAVNHKRKIADVMKLGSIKGLYLRYIPQQWLAAIPARSRNVALPGSREHIELIAELSSVAQVVGWSTTMSFGSITSLNNDMGSFSSYATMSLASPAMPTATGGWVIDGGCYHIIDPDVIYPECDGISCFECARFGRTPTNDERALWKRIADEHPEASDRTLMIDDLEKPYPTGMWSSYTQQLIEGRISGKERVQYQHRQDGPRGLSQRPQLMPHEVKLPAGVTSCIIPAGTYLCTQCDEGGQAGSHDILKGIAMSIKHEEFTVEEEIKRFESTLKPPPHSARKQKPGPILEPFAMPRSPGDPMMSGWCKTSLTQSEIQSLVLPTHMALWPEDGFCIICNPLPATNPNAPSRYELCFLVRCDEITPPHEDNSPDG